ncbi:alpha/beta fold hydrolase [Polymorphobacter arshaanensis]|uniref:Alpha/beta fold hydrolase n=1 Tax=Glacieibacterium arshaanense TaxID=2511025 RepID=A0A4Y9ENM4_9SPHN|nr:alpha/beta hydrolase [Polymorphobacter arshaanensis]TFU03652.1 alpha/beta fold hydrolase [Polymorphobacter arshaanensis]
MTKVNANGISIEVESYGALDAPTVLLIMGLGAQLTLWPIELVDALVARGFRVVRFDNRDIGLSTKFDSAGIPDMPSLMMALMGGKAPDIAYTLTDMANDAVAVLDALGIAQAHIVGASMGGMIAQLVAANHPTRTRTLTSIMSTTGNRELPPAKPDAMAALTGRPTTADVDAIVAFGVAAARIVGSPAYPAEESRLTARVRADFERSFSPAGFARQMAAIVADGDRRDRNASITAPTLVIHGDADPLVPVEGGHDTAASIKDAELMIIPGMGHDLPVQLVDQIADAIAKVAAR